MPCVFANRACSARRRSFFLSTQVWKRRQLEGGRVCNTGGIGPRHLDSLPPSRVDGFTKSPVTSQQLLALLSSLKIKYYLTIV